MDTPKIAFDSVAESLGARLPDMLPCFVGKLLGFPRVHLGPAGAEFGCVRRDILLIGPCGYVWPPLETVLDAAATAK